MLTSFMDGPCNASAYPWGQFVASKTNNIKGKRKRTEKAHVAFHHKQRQIKIQNNKAPFVHRSPFNFIKRDYNCALNVFFRPSLHQPFYVAKYIN